MRLFSNYVATRDRVMLVAPGQSSDNAIKHLTFGHIATVNRAALLIPGAIDFAFCNDLEALDAIRPAWDRIRTFVVPDRIGIRNKVSERSWAECGSPPSDRALVFPHLPAVSTAEDVARAAGDPRRLAVCNSACAGLHALGRMGYRKIWVIGCDGGTAYSSILADGGFGVDYSVIRERMENIADQIAIHDNAEVKFWPEKFE